MPNERAQIDPGSLPHYRGILIAADASDQSNKGVDCAVDIGRLYSATITGAHVYAAKLHDVRFRQMEGGLPEPYREESELEKQRDIHDDLITKGLSVITDSYLDQVENACEKGGLSYKRRSLEGKNYSEMVREANSGNYDLLVMGGRGLGAVSQAYLGTVCDRVTRRSDIDVLVVKNPETELSGGPLMVGIDGSSRAYGALMTTFSMAHHWGLPVHVVSAFDPYYHYVAFNRIAAVLSDEAGKVFRFKEQEKLHEDIIDAGLAKIYQGHLDVAESIAQDYGIEITTKLLTGKPHVEIAKEVAQVNPAMVALGKTGIHADEALDIGGNTANLLRDLECAVLLSQREHTPDIEMLAESSTSWTREAEQRMGNIPVFARGMAKMAILRYTQERGHTVVTESIVDEATAGLCPARMGMEDTPEEEKTLELDWSESAIELANSIIDPSLRVNICKRAEKLARQEKCTEVQTMHLAGFIDSRDQQADLHWNAAALARLSRVPAGFMRDSSKERIENTAREQRCSEVDLDLVEAELAKASQAMKTAVQDGDGKCPRQPETDGTPGQQGDTEKSWSPEAQKMLERVPEGTIRAMARKATESIGTQAGITDIDEDFFRSILDTFSMGSGAVDETLAWSEEARAGIGKAPAMVRGMLVREIEAFAREQGLDRVDVPTVHAVKNRWDETGFFHQAGEDPRSAP